MFKILLSKVSDTKLICLNGADHLEYLGVYFLYVITRKRGNGEWLFCIQISLANSLSSVPKL